MEITSKLGPSGDLSLRVLPRVEKAPWYWRLRQRPTYILSYFWGWLTTQMARGFSRLTGIVTLTSELRVRVLDKRTGRWVDYGVVGRRVVTDAGVQALVDDWDDDSKDITAFNEHGFGSGTTAEAAGDTDLVTEFTTQYSTDNTRPSGTKTQSSPNVLQTVATFNPDASVTVEEHGLFNNATVGSGILWDRTLTGSLSLTSSHSLESTYQCTVSSGS